MKRINNFGEFSQLNEGKSDVATPHKWTKNDTILALYFVKYGIKSIPVKSKKELANEIIGTSADSLEMQSANIRKLLGEKGSYVLDDVKKMQKDVVAKYGEVTKSELQKVVDDIIDNVDRVKNIEEFERRSDIKVKNKDTKDRKKKSTDKLNDDFRKRGFDPSKMKSLGRRKKE